jgi:hypothetical protein
MDNKIKNTIKMSLEAKRLLQKQLLILPSISNPIQKVGVKNYRKNKMSSKNSKELEKYRNEIILLFNTL